MVWADNVNLVDLRRADGTFGPIASLYDPAYYQPSKASTQRLGGSKFALRTRGPCSFVRISFAVDQAGQHTLLLADLIADPVNEGGRGLLIYKQGTARPVHRVMDSDTNDGNKAEPADVYLPLQVTPEEANEGKVTLIFRPATASPAYCGAVGLIAPGQSREDVQLAQYHERFSDMLPDVTEAAPWNFGAEGLGLGGQIGWGSFATISLHAPEAGKYRLTLQGLRLPPVGPEEPVIEVYIGHSVAPAVTLNREDFRQQSDGVGWSGVVDISGAAIIDSRVTLRLVGLTDSPVYLRSVGLAPELPEVRPGQWDTEEVDDLLLWTRSPWLSVDALARPAKPQDAEQIVMAMAQGEYRCSVVMATNCLKLKRKVARVWARATNLTETETGAQLGADHIQLKHLYRVLDYSGDKRWIALPPLSRSHPLAVPHGTTGQIWLVVDTAGVSPGTYHGYLRVYTDVGIRKTLPLQVTVWPFAMPRYHPLKLNTWLYLEWENKDVLREHAIAYGTNVIIDYYKNGQQAVKESIRLCQREHGFFLMGFNKVMGRHPVQGHPYMSEGWKKAVTEQFRTARRWLLNAGMSYDEFAFYPYDEYIGPDFIAVAKLIRSVDPHIKIFTDCAWNVEMARKAAPYLDIWCPSYGIWFQDDFKQIYDFLKSTGKPIWYYNASRVNRGWPPNFLRTHCWRAWRWDLQGAGFWTYLADYHIGVAILPQECGLSEYAWPVSSRQLEAWREGAQDYCYLWLLQKHIDLARKRGEDVAWATQLLERAVRDVTDHTGDPLLPDQWRMRLARTLLQLLHI